MRVLNIKVYTIEEHPNNELCFDWIRDNWHHLNQHSVDEFIESLKALQKQIGGKLDYSIGQLSCRGEYIRLDGYDRDILMNLPEDECFLTGVCWDDDIIRSLKNYGNFEYALDKLHFDSEYVYSDKGLTELCLFMDYEFNEEGELIN